MVLSLTEKLLNSTGRDLRRALFSLKQIFQVSLSYCLNCNHNVLHLRNILHVPIQASSPNFGPHENQLVNMNINIAHLDK